MQSQAQHLRRGSTSTSANTTELLQMASARRSSIYRVRKTHRSVVTGSTLLLSSVIPLSVLSVTSGWPVSTASSVTTGSVTSVSGRSTSGSGRLHVSLGNDLRWDVEELSEVGETLVGEGVVVPLPRELGLDESLGGQGLHGLDDLEVSDGDVGVLGSVEVLGSDEDTLLE
jgi:hypothetical protein